MNTLNEKRNKAEARKFQLITEDVPAETLLKEFDIHPILVKLAFSRKTGPSIK